MVDHPQQPPEDDADEIPTDRVSKAIATWLEDGTPFDAEAWGADERRRAADQLWLHGVLSQWGTRDAAGHEQRVARVISAIAREEPIALPPGMSRRKRWWWSPVAAAAVIVMAVAFLRPFINTRQTAMAAVNSALQQAELPEDRHYALEMVLATPPNHTRTTHGQLWVRGGSRYVLKHQGFIGELTLGSNGETYWLVPSLGPVVVGNNPGIVEQRLFGDRLTAPTLQVASILDRLSQRYDLTLLDDVDLTVPGEPTPIRCTHVLGRLQESEDPLSPNSIELWADEKSGVAQRLLLKWDSAHSPQGLESLEFQLQPAQEPTSDDWFEHQSHHAADRTVITRQDDESP